MLSFLLFPPSSTTTLDLLSLHDALPISFFVADPVTMLPYESSLRRGPACPGSPGGRGIDYGDEGNPSWSPRGAGSHGRRGRAVHGSRAHLPHRRPERPGAGDPARRNRPLLPAACRRRGGGGGRRGGDRSLPARGPAGGFTASHPPAGGAPPRPGPGAGRPRRRPGSGLPRP